MLSVKPNMVAAYSEKGEEIAPGVHWKALKEVLSPVQGFATVRWEEITWQPGAKFGPITMKEPMFCEIITGSLDQEIE